MAENFSESLLSYPITESALAESQKAQALVLAKNSLCDSEQVIYLSGPLHLKNERVALGYP